MCSGVRWMPGSARLVRLEAAPEGPPAFVVPSQAPQLYGARSPKLSSHCKVVFPLQASQVYASDPAVSVHHSVSCLRRGVLWMPMGLGAEASVCSLDAQGAPRSLERKPSRVQASLEFQVIWRGPPRGLALAGVCQGCPSNLARAPSVTWLLSRAPLHFGAGPSVAWLLSRAPFHFGAGPVLAWFLSR